VATPILLDGFNHHVWATVRLIDTCLELTPDQLATEVPGTFGSILETLRHLVGADASYLHVISGKRVPLADHSGNGLAELRTAMEAHGVEWRAVVAENLDPTEVVIRHRPDGSESHAPLGIRLAQVLHHGTDHRSQVCTALTNLGVEPPEIDVWDFGWLDGRVFEVEPN
jgi:uncharacterized damage-inducible protein DinB